MPRHRNEVTPGAWPTIRPLPQINVVVRDMQRSLAFYRLLGVSIEDTRAPEWRASFR